MANVLRYRVDRQINLHCCICAFGSTKKSDSLTRYSIKHVFDVSVTLLTKKKTLVDNINGAERTCTSD